MDSDSVEKTVVQMAHAVAVMKEDASAESSVEQDKTKVDVWDNKKVCKLAIGMVERRVVKKALQDEQMAVWKVDKMVAYSVEHMAAWKDAEKDVSMVGMLVYEMDAQMVDKQVVLLVDQKAGKKVE